MSGQGFQLYYKVRNVKQFAQILKINFTRKNHLAKRLTKWMGAVYVQFHLKNLAKIS
jgi:hypothetical protein